MRKQSTFVAVVGAVALALYAGHGLISWMRAPPPCSPSIYAFGTRQSEWNHVECQPGQTGRYADVAGLLVVTCSCPAPSHSP